MVLSGFQVWFSDINLTLSGTHMMNQCFSKITFHFTVFTGINSGGYKAGDQSGMLPIPGSPLPYFSQKLPNCGCVCPHLERKCNFQKTFCRAGGSKLVRLFCNIYRVGHENVTRQARSRVVSGHEARQWHFFLVI